jgi:hypothetical protein
MEQPHGETGSGSCRHMSPSDGGSVTIAGKLVRFLRSGVKLELGASAAIIEAETAADTHLKPKTYYGALARFEDARTLLDEIGVSDQLEPQDVELDLACWPRLLLKALESQLDLELIRLEGARADGIDLPPRDLQALACLVDDIRRKVGAPATREPEQSRLERQLARRPPRRSRGDG